MFWQHNARKVILNDSIILLTDSSINILNISEHHLGSWMVTADNGVGNVARKQITLKLQQKIEPIEVYIEAQTNYNLGDKINIMCSVKGSNHSKIQWSKNNNQVKTSQILEISKSSSQVIIAAASKEGMRNKLLLIFCNDILCR